MKNRTVLLLIACLLGLFTLPGSFVNGARGAAVMSMSPFWQGLVDVKMQLHSQEAFSGDGDVQTKEQEVQRLLLENQLLGNEIAYLKELVQEEQEMGRAFLDGSFAHAVSKEDFSRHQKEVLAEFNLRLVHFPARVIYRPLNAWHSSIWVDKGEKDNQEVGRVVIAKNSPVVIGTAVVGVVDYVGEKQSRVRLITDSGLNVSVRIKRGAWLLAKGELIGIGKPLSRTHLSLLKGVGFNYDFSDKEGPRRDLRTGEPLEKKSSVPAMPLVKVDDLLVTTGMDGVFPPNLNVGVVKKIVPLKEGDYAYDLEAESSLKELNSLMLVFILPPIGV